jgi:hypothetical protein
MEELPYSEQNLFYDTWYHVSRTTDSFRELEKVVISLSQIYELYISKGKDWDLVMMENEFDLNMVQSYQSITIVVI